MNFLRTMSNNIYLKNNKTWKVYENLVFRLSSQTITSLPIKQRSIVRLIKTQSKANILTSLRSMWARVILNALNLKIIAQCNPWTNEKEIGWQPSKVEIEKNYTYSWWNTSRENCNLNLKQLLNKFNRLNKRSIIFAPKIKQ
jgi:G:T/U-mismatch repair DNA glycosylase